MSERITYQGTNFVELLGTVDVATGAYLATGTAIARLYDDTKDTTVAPITAFLTADAVKTATELSLDDVAFLSPNDWAILYRRNYAPGLAHPEVFSQRFQITSIDYTNNTVVVPALAGDHRAGDLLRVEESGATHVTIPVSDVSRFTFDLATAASCGTYEFRMSNDTAHTATVTAIQSAGTRHAVQVSGAPAASVLAGSRVCRKLGADLAMAAFGETSSDLDSWGWRAEIPAATMLELRPGMRVRVEFTFTSAGNAVLRDNSLVAIVVE